VVNVTQLEKEDQNVRSRRFAILVVVALVVLGPGLWWVLSDRSQKDYCLCRPVIALERFDKVPHAAQPGVAAGGDR
jgi:hypothetical protein